MVAWIIGWDLILEYGVSVAAVAVGWGGNLNELLEHVRRCPASCDFSASVRRRDIQPARGDHRVCHYLAVGYWRPESAQANFVMVIIKLAVLVFFIVAAATAINADNFTPFAPAGFDGVVTASAIIFFAYIGFDAVSTGSEEAKDPKQGPPSGHHWIARYCDDLLHSRLSRCGRIAPR